MRFRNPSEKRSRTFVQEAPKAVGCAPLHAYFDFVEKTPAVDMEENHPFVRAREEPDHER